MANGAIGDKSMAFRATKILVYVLPSPFSFPA